MSNSVLLKRINLYSGSECKQIALTSFKICFIEIYFIEIYFTENILYWEYTREQHHFAFKKWKKVKEQNLNRVWTEPEQGLNRASTETNYMPTKKVLFNTMDSFGWNSYFSVKKESLIWCSVEYIAFSNIDFSFAHVNLTARSETQASSYTMTANELHLYGLHSLNARYQNLL